MFKNVTVNYQYTDIFGHDQLITADAYGNEDKLDKALRYVRNHNGACAFITRTDGACFRIYRAREGIFETTLIYSETERDATQTMDMRKARSELRKFLKD